jgi:hypothetical protein
MSIKKSTDTIGNRTRWVEVQIHVFITAVIDQRHTPAALSLRKQPLGTHQIGNWVNPRACLDAMERRQSSALTGFEALFPGNPVRSLLTILRYPQWGRTRSWRQGNRRFYVLPLQSVTNVSRDNLRASIRYSKTENNVYLITHKRQEINYTTAKFVLLPLPLRFHSLRTKTKNTIGYSTGYSFTVHIYVHEFYIRTLVAKNVILVYLYNGFQGVLYP